MEISAEKTKLMTNSASGIKRDIKVKGQKLGTVTNFKYLVAVVSDDGSKPEVLSRIAQATAFLTKLKPIRTDNNISLGSKVKLMRSLVISICLYARESWTLTAELEKRRQAFEMRCYRRILNISYTDHVTNEKIRRNTPDPGQETKAKMVWPCFKVFWFSKGYPTGHSKRKKKKRQTEEKVGRQNQRVDMNGLRQLN